METKLTTQQLNKLTTKKEGYFVNSIRECDLKKMSLKPKIISCIPADGPSRHDPLTLM